MLAIYKKELRQYFSSMIGFAFLAFFLAIIGIYTWAYNFASGLGNFEVTLGSISFLFVLLIPILTMRILAEENHQKTNQLLYTAPVSITKIILGKYLAVMTLFLIGIAVIAVYPLIISMYGSGVRLSMAYSSIIGFFLLGAASIAIGLFISALTESQAIAAVVSFIVLLLTFLMGNISDMLPTDALTQCVLLTIIWLAVTAVFYHMIKKMKVIAGIFVLGVAIIWVLYFVKSSIFEGLVNKGLGLLAISTRFEDFSLGILNYDSIIYYVSITVLFLFLAVQMIRSQQFKSGAYSSVLIVLTIGIVVALNLVFSRLDFSSDLSSGSLFTLSKETKKAMEELDNDVTIYYMVQEGSEESYIDNVLKQYKKVSKHISVKKIDPVVNPGFAAKQGIEDEVMSNDVIVVNEKTKSAKYVAGTEMLYSNQDYTTGSSVEYLDVEGQVTSAIQNVAADDKPKLYMLTRHSEQALGTSLNKALEKMNIEIEELELAKEEKLPEDCDILYINGPESDLTDEETDKVLDYLKNGGKAMITIAYTEEKLPNLEKILKEYGVKVVSGIIFEGAGNYASYVNNVVPSVTGNADLLSDINGYIMFPNASGLEQVDSSSMREGVTITDLLATSDSSYVKTDPSSGEVGKEDGDVDGPFAVGLLITEEQQNEEDEKEAKETKLIVYSSALAFTEELTATSQIENANVFKQSVSALTTTKGNEVSIDSKDLSYSYISVDPALQLFWAAVIIILLPAGLLITGFIIWFVRRRK